MPRLLSKTIDSYWLTWLLALGTASFDLPTSSAGAQPAVATPVALEAKFAGLFDRMPPVRRHYDGITEADVRDQWQQDRNYRELLREKIRDPWFAALLSVKPGEMLSIQRRFETWKGLMDFILERKALVDVWAYTEGSLSEARRIPAPELARLKRQTAEQPTFITVTYREEATGQIIRLRVEFGFRAAEQAWAAQQGYHRHREIQMAAREVLGVRDRDGKLNARTQWEAITRAAAADRLPLAELPPEPTNRYDLFVAFEIEVDEFNNFSRVVRVHRESEIQRRVVRDPGARYVQALILKRPGESEGREVRGYRVRDDSDNLEPAPTPVPGQDFVELRIKDPGESDVRRWNVLEFGEPELLKQSALARFSLINAHLDKQRKALAIKKSNLDLIAEPIFAGLNIGGGLALVPFPIGEAARLGYNTLVTPWFIPDVPSVKEMRELFQLMAAQDRFPELKTKPGDFLDEHDFKQLRAAAKNLTDAEVVDYLQRIQDEDLKGMLRLAKMQRLDARLMNLLAIMADAGKVSGWTDEAGFQRDVFNSIYFSVSGDVSIKNIIAVLVSGSVATPHSGISLKTLSDGDGAQLAWLQFLNFTVDIRAVLNTVARLSHRDLADKELKKPFPYAPRLGDLAAYEIRIFGFPLLIFYKRGLLKDDYAAFQSDYAYGLLGARIVEHFRTRAEMDAEIRAGRMVPLGYVRVPDGKGGWKETNLAVFAHRVPGGKYKGKTVILIYGLKAYREHSELVEREYQRFKQFERGLEQGAVIEQVVDAQDREPIPATEFEPKLHVGPDAGEEIFSPLLSNLLELRRYAQCKAWGLPLTPAEADTVETIARELAARGIKATPDDDPLLGLDRYSSSFRYKKYEDGKWRVIKLTRLPGRADGQRELAKAAEGRRVEQLRHQAVLPQGEGGVLLNTVKEVNGRREIGPLVRDRNGEVVGAGVRSGGKAMEEMFEFINQLPVVDRARLQFNHFAATVVELDADGDGATEKVFLTMEFPVGKEIRREWTNPLSGEQEALTCREGRLVGVATDRRLVEFDYDQNNQEIASRVYFNSGTRQQPVKGALLEETRTIESWFRDLSRPGVDPYLPLLSKLKVDYVTGRAARETYGLFPLPIATTDEQWVTQNRFNAYGLFASAEALENGAPEDVQRPLLDQLLEPAPARPRFLFASTLPDLAGRRDLKGQDYRTVIERKDLLRGLSRTLVFDNARSGRKAGESFVDAFDGNQSFGVSVTPEYRDDFFFGLIPFKTALRDAASGALLTEVETTGYDAVSRRLTGVEMDHTGKTSTNVWDHRWESPVEMTTALRRTVIRHNHDETAFAGTTVATSSGEELGSFSGRFEVATKTWRVDRIRWHRPGITNRVVVETLSGFGKLMSVRAGDVFETRPVYDAGGIARTNRLFLRNPVTSQFDLLHRLEDDYHWRAGERDARVQTFLEGRPHDTFRTVSDSEGRTIRDGIRQLPGLDVATLLAYDEATDRVVQTEETQNGQLRVRRLAEPEQKQPDGSWRLPVRIVPSWGLVATQTFVIGDALNRPLSTRYENGDRAEVREWFAGTALAKISELVDRQGRARERHVKSPGRGVEQGIPFDVTSRYRLSFWGQAGLAEAEATARGTDIALFQDAAEERTYYDLTRVFKVPWFSIDPHGISGIAVTLRQARKTNVLTIFNARLQERAVPSGTNQALQPALELTAADLRGLFYHKLTSRIIDRAGKVLEERIGRITNLGQSDYTDETIFSAPANLIKKVRHRYEPGWLVERPDAQSGGRMFVFTREKPAPGANAMSVNDGPWLDFVTRIEGVQTASDERAETSDVAIRSLFRSIHTPRERERNPYMPDQPDAWTAWTSTEFRTDGEKLFDAETIYDAQGRLRIARATKTTSSGRPAIKITYQLPAADPAALREYAVERRDQAFILDAGGRQDFSGSDFVYFYLANAADIALVVTDAFGTSVKVGKGNPDFKQHAISTWSVDSANVRWLPDATAPRQGTVVTAPAFLLKEGSLVVVSVHDLARAGLDVHRVRSFALSISGWPKAPLKVSALYRLERGGNFTADEESLEFSHEVREHGTGLKSFVRIPQRRTTHEVYGGHHISTVTEFNGLPVASSRARASNVEYPHAVVVDHSDTDSPRPLYSISLNEGHFIEHYKLLKLGDAQVYSVVKGFELPRLEVYSGKALEDEITPGYIAYGDNYEVTVQYAKGRGPLGRPLAGLHNRVVANAFKFGGDRLLKLATGGDTRPEFFSHFDFATLQNAQAQAEEISRLPMLAEALLPTRETPWRPGPPTRAAESATDWKALALKLSRLHLLYSITGLIPTSLGTAVERYVDTVKEADIIILAAKLGEIVLARELLDFYWEKSQGGQVPLHASYDAQAGTAMTTDLMYRRAVHSRRTAEAQLAVADAAFNLGAITGNAQWLTMGRNLTSLVLREFRPADATQSAPRGITEYQFISPKHVYGLRFLPEAETYSLRSNARAYLLLRQLNEVIGRYFSDAAWGSEISPALQEQEAWLRKFILPQVERTGVVPYGVFQIQDVSRQTTALGVERWTSAEDWLIFLEAAQRMGIPAESTRHWLENLARVHGVRVNQVWGLDWTIALARPDAISTDLTAKFLRVARLLGHDAAEIFAQQNLKSLEQGGDYPAVASETPRRRALRTGQGATIHPQTNYLNWPSTLGVHKELREVAIPGWDLSRATRLVTRPIEQVWQPQRTDLTIIILITAVFYLSILISTVFWWRFRALRRSEQAVTAGATQVVPDAVMRRAEERWAKRVLGVQTPARAERTRFSNAPVEQNFLMQLRTIYKLVLEWRRRENGWAEDDPRLAEGESDGWLNGLDEFACLMGIYMRSVIKAGAKDGFARQHVLTENEDSNHIWSRLTMYFAEYYWALLPLLKIPELSDIKSRRDQDSESDPFAAFPGLGGDPLEHHRAEINSKIMLLLNVMGLRQRREGFDARILFDCPANPSALDLLIIQKHGITLTKVMREVALKLQIPFEHILRVVGAYKEFKEREKPDPLHPYLIEFGKVLPHFLLMGLGALVWYNQTIGDSPIVPYVWSVATHFALSPASLGWGLPLFAALMLSVLTHVTRIYRHDASMLPRGRPEFFLDATVTSLFTREQTVIPQAKAGRWWNPAMYEGAGWAMRVLGFLGLGIALLRLETPSFTTFLLVKGLLAMLAFAEVAGIVVPLASTAISKYLQDRVTSRPQTWKITRFASRLNITATRPASPSWLSIRYHTQPSVPSGDFWGIVQAVTFYFALAAVFFFAGGYLCQQVLSLWFTDTYLSASNAKLFFGSLLFWNTMYLLRYGLFLFFTGLASWLATFPIKATFGLLAGAQVGLTLFGPSLGMSTDYSTVTWPVMFVGLGLMVFEDQLMTWLRRIFTKHSDSEQTDAATQKKLAQIKTDKSATLAVVYMSGDDLSYLKLTPSLLMTRWNILRDKLGSQSVRLLSGMVDQPDDAALEAWFKALYDTEKEFDVTLWHPLQLCLSGETPSLRSEWGLNLVVENAEQRRQLLAAWHVRRWLVAMMSTAGHSQDTGVNLVDVALRLSRDGLAANSVFYLIQNKYDNNENNRPSQTPYDQGELNQRNKLARLLCAAAPGARAFNLQNWTPFGFKAGGLTGMDLVYEESLNLTTMLLLDRNATVHDLDALMKDLARALTDPDVVIIIPGRSTTNTLTVVGQGSQTVEEGHRSFLKGLLSLLGGRASEAVGTGWGNMLAVYYGRAQRAMVDLRTPRMPLTSRMQRGASFALKFEGIIGFTPHAVGISEDTWAVSQTAHNAMALGRRVKFLLSSAMWHKIRETWSHSEWLASFPRWSGGYLQMMHDPIMQRINDFGPNTIFAKEVRANSGRNFLTAPFALLNILLMPLAIMLDVTPFVQILIVLWNFGFVMNQILTVHGLNTYLESSGFYRVPALLGAAAAGLCFSNPTLQPYAPALVVLGFVGGGFFVGLTRWLYTRVRDTILFGPQLVLHTMGQVVRQSLEFVVSGASPEDAKAVNMPFRAWAGPREDRPLDRFTHFINLKTVVWLVGLLSVVLNLFALANLDMLNVLLLLPSLLFSVSTLIGPFVMSPKVGKPIGKRVLVPKVLGWMVTLSFYTFVSLLVAQGGWPRWIGVVAMVLLFTLLLKHGLKYLFYRSKVNRVNRRLMDLLRAAGLAAGDIEKLARQIMQQAAGDSARLQTELEGGGIPADHLAAVVKLARDAIGPLLRKPVLDLQTAPFAQNRWVSEFNRSFVLSLFVLVWFFIVPVPGLFVFTAGDYRCALGLWTILLAVGIAIALAVAGAWIGAFIQWTHRRGLREHALGPRIEHAYRRFQSLLGASNSLTAAETANIFAAFTDIQTYVDQRSYSYAGRMLAAIEKNLGEASARRET